MKNIKSNQAQKENWLTDISINETILSQTLIETSAIGDEESRANVVSDDTEEAIEDGACKKF